MTAKTISAILPRSLEKAAQRCFPFALLATGRILPVVRLSGATRTGQATIVAAGAGPAAFQLSNRFFQGSPQRHLLARVPVWRLETTLRRLGETADLTLARLDSLTSGFVFDNSALRIPDWVEAGLDLPVDIRAMARGHDSLRDDLRLIRRSAFTAEISHDQRDLAGFYNGMYVPFSLARHGTLAVLRPEQWLMKRFRRGGIIWIVQSGRRVAGILFEQEGSILHLCAEGTIQGDVTLLKSGVVAAMYFHSIEYGNQRGCAFANFGGCHACLTDGLLRHKRKWGMSLRPKPDNYFFTLLRWEKWNQRVAAFLSELPVLHQSAAGLLGVTALSEGQPGTPGAAAHLQESLWLPGLRRMVVVNSGTSALTPEDVTSL